LCSSGAGLGRLKDTQLLPSQDHSLLVVGLFGVNGISS
jgi:hypothetical protein